MGERAPRIALDSDKYSVRSSISVWVGIAAAFWLVVAILVALAS